MADEVDRANDLSEDRRNVQIKTISRALERKSVSVECIDCGEDIEPKRREALPSAVRCISCQDAWEIYTRTHRN